MADAGAADAAECGLNVEGTVALCAALEPHSSLTALLLRCACFASLLTFKANTISFLSGAIAVSALLRRCSALARLNLNCATRKGKISHPPPRELPQRLWHRARRQRAEGLLAADVARIERSDVVFTFLPPPQRLRSMRMAPQPLQTFWPPTLI